MLVSYRLTNSLCHLLQMWDVAVSTDVPGTVQESWSHTSVQGWEITMIYVIHQIPRCAPLGYPINKDISLQESIIFRSFHGNSMRKKKHLPGTDMEDNVLWLNLNYTASDRVWDTKSPLPWAAECWAKSKHLKHSVNIAINKMKNHKRWLQRKGPNPYLISHYDLVQYFCLDLKTPLFSCCSEARISALREGVQFLLGWWVHSALLGIC